MKICMITSYPPDKCGVSDYSERLVKELRKIGQQVMIISRQGKGIRGEKNTTRLIATKRVERSLMQAVEEFRNLGRAISDADKSTAAIKEFSPDVVHVQYEPGLYNLFFLPILLSRLKELGIKSVITLHGMDYFPLNIFHRAAVYGKPGRIIVHTRRHYESLKAELPHGQTKKIRIVPMGLMKGKKAKGGNHILFFGFLNQHKGVEDLLQAFAGAGVKENLLMVGSINPAYRPDVEYKDKIQDLIRTLGAEDRVKFIYQFVPRKKLENYIKNSMFVVFPYRSSYSGGQSQAILDALAFGKPLIITRPAQGNLTDNENAVVINPGNIGELTEAIRKLSRSSGLRKRLSSNNRKLAARLGWKNIARATLGIYESMLI
ncbi:MAG: glycosyltransferase [Candidatus Aenigmarchaeota archaeon]|nr:glycosyltransferase [Candidatus Aenigmarchaeota archaeon]